MHVKKKFNKKIESIEGHGVKVTISAKAIHDMLCIPMTWGAKFFDEEHMDVVGEAIIRIFFLCR